jgi:hypothetical protein
VRRALFALLAFAQHAPPARPFQRFDGCIYKPQRWNDGDSFHVILPDRKEVIFRLYFVDTLEEERAFTQTASLSRPRISELARMQRLKLDARQANSRSRRSQNRSRFRHAGGSRWAAAIFRVIMQSC